jgi:hypothetical protein
MIFVISLGIINLYKIKWKKAILEDLKRFEKDTINLYRKEQFEKLKIWLTAQDIRIMDDLIKKPYQRPNESSLDYKEGYLKALEHVRDYVEKLEREE